MSKERATQLIEAGVWLKLSGDLEGAQRLFERALTLDPENPQLLSLLAGGPLPDVSQSSLTGFTIPPSSGNSVPPLDPTAPAATASVGEQPIVPTPAVDADWGMATGFASPPRPARTSGVAPPPPSAPPQHEVHADDPTAQHTIRIDDPPPLSPPRGTPPIFETSIDIPIDDDEAPTQQQGILAAHEVAPPAQPEPQRQPESQQYASSTSRIGPPPPMGVGTVTLSGGPIAETKPPAPAPTQSRRSPAPAPLPSPPAPAELFHRPSQIAKVPISSGPSLSIDISTDSDVHEPAMNAAPAAPASNTSSPSGLSRGAAPQPAPVQPPVQPASSASAVFRSQQSSPSAVFRQSSPSGLQVRSSGSGVVARPPATVSPSSVQSEDVDISFDEPAWNWEGKTEQRDSFLEPSKSAIQPAPPSARNSAIGVNPFASSPSASALSGSSVTGGSVPGSSPSGLSSSGSSPIGSSPSGMRGSSASGSSAAGSGSGARTVTPAPAPMPTLAEAAQTSPFSPQSGWDGPSSPGVTLQPAGSGETKALDMVLSETPAPPLLQKKATTGEVQTLLSGARDLLDLDDHTGAMELIMKAHSLAPNDPDVQAMRERSEKTLLAMFESKLGNLSTTPRVLLKDDEIIWLNLDHRAGFVLAQIDGSVCFDDLFAVSGMTRLDTARILAQLIDEGVISRG